MSTRLCKGNRTVVPLCLQYFVSNTRARRHVDQSRMNCAKTPRHSPALAQKGVQKRSNKPPKRNGRARDSGHVICQDFFGRFAAMPGDELWSIRLQRQQIIDPKSRTVCEM